MAVLITEIELPPIDGISSKRVEPIDGGVFAVVVDDDRCDGCAYCIEPCPFHSLKLIEYQRDGMVKKTVEVNEISCRGCGICAATCPKNAMHPRHMSRVLAEMDEALGKQPETPQSCVTCRVFVPMEFDVPKHPAVKIMCSGRANPYLILRSFELGTNGVLVINCYFDTKKNNNFEEAIDVSRKLLETLGFDSKRIRVEDVTPSDPNFSKVVKEFARDLKKWKN